MPQQVAAYWNDSLEHIPIYVVRFIRLEPVIVQ